MTRLPVHISLSSILLFALVTPFIMNTSLHPTPGRTSYILFGLIFLSLISYLFIDVFLHSKKYFFKLKSVLLWTIIVLVLGSAFISTVIARHKTAPVYQVHDIILQQEAAIRFFLTGKNPYSETYFGTPLEDFHYSSTDVNPALYHFVMEPFYLLFSLPFYFISNHTIGYFDARIPLYLLFITLLFMAYILPKEHENKLTFVTLLAFNPAMLGYTLEGRSDIFMYAFLFSSFLFLCKEKYSLSSIPMALAFAVKQSVWPILPFYFVYLYAKQKKGYHYIKPIVIFFVVFLAIVLPFFLWNQKAFVDSTINYLSGSTVHSYPISGYGLGMVLNELGIINNLKEYYPFIIWQVVICIPLLFMLLKHLIKNPHTKNLVLVYGVFLFVYWYLSRYFNNSHLGYLSLVFITAYFLPEKE